MTTLSQSKPYFLGKTRNFDRLKLQPENIRCGRKSAKYQVTCVDDVPRQPTDISDMTHSSPPKHTNDTPKAHVIWSEDPTPLTNIDEISLGPALPFTRMPYSRHRRAKTLPHVLSSGTTLSRLLKQVRDEDKRFRARSKHTVYAPHCRKHGLSPKVDHPTLSSRNRDPESPSRHKKKDANHHNHSHVHDQRDLSVPSKILQSSVSWDPQRLQSYIRRHAQSSTIYTAIKNNQSLCYSRHTTSRTGINSPQKYSMQPLATVQELTDNDSASETQEDPSSMNKPRKVSRKPFFHDSGHQDAVASNRSTIEVPGPIGRTVREKTENSTSLEQGASYLPPVRLKSSRERTRTYSKQSNRHDSIAHSRSDTTHNHEPDNITSRKTSSKIRDDVSIRRSNTRQCRVLTPSSISSPSTHTSTEYDSQTMFLDKLGRLSMSMGKTDGHKSLFALKPYAPHILQCRPNAAMY